MIIKPNEVEVLYLFHEESGYEKYLDIHALCERKGLDFDNTFKIVRYLKDNYLLEGTFHSDGGMFRISNYGIDAIREIEAQKNKSKRDKLLDRCNKQSPLWPFISIIVAIVALIISIIALQR